MNLNELLINIIDTQIDVETQGLCLNAANIQTGDVFVALQGRSTHGIDYIDQAIENGCVAVLVDSQDFIVTCQAYVLKISSNIYQC